MTASRRNTRQTTPVLPPAATDTPPAAPAVLTTLDLTATLVYVPWEASDGLDHSKAKFRAVNRTAGHSGGSLFTARQKSCPLFKGVLYPEIDAITQALESHGIEQDPTGADIIFRLKFA
jgi:hypothetical protein